MDIRSQFDNSLSIALTEDLSSSNYAAALQTIGDNKYGISLESNCSDTIAVLANHLTDENFCQKPELYETCERLLKIVADKSHVEEVLFELLEIVETTKSDNVFTTALKALQICLQRQKDNKARSLEWCVNSIFLYISKLACSENVRNKSVEPDQQRLLEENDDVRRILTNYITLFLFYEPVLDGILAKQEPTVDFRNVNITKKNVMTCFVLQLLGPIYFLDFSQPTVDKKSLTNTYSWQCATTLVRHFSKLCPDPIFMLTYVERRFRWPRKTLKSTTEDDGGVYEAAPKDLFALDEKLPDTALAVFYYLIYAEDLMPATAPRVYSHLYQFEMILYIAASILKDNEHVLHYKTLKLCHYMLDKFGPERIPMHSLDLDIHEVFVTQLIRMLTQTPIKQNSQYGAMLIRKYIFQFDNDGRYFLLNNLFRITEHNGLYGYLAAMYKDMMAEALNSDSALSNAFTGEVLHRFLLKHICTLNKGAETDLLQNSDQIITALNMCRFLALRDRENRTTFWDLIDQLRDHFLKPLQTGIEFTKAHYKLEERRVADGLDEDNVKVGVSLTTGEQLPEITKEAKLKMISSAMNTFDLMESLLSRVNECLRTEPMGKL